MCVQSVQSVCVMLLCVCKVCCVCVCVRVGYPNEEAAHVALKTVREWLEKNSDKVTTVSSLCKFYLLHGTNSKLLEFTIYCCVCV